MKKLFFLAIAFAFIACNNSSKYSKLPEKNAEQHEQTEQYEVSELVVSEVLEGGGYTYLKGKSGDEEIWVAIPQKDVKVGQTVYFDGGMLMKNFESKALNRTFEGVWFLEDVAFDKSQLKRPTEMKNPHQRPASTSNAAAKQERPPLPKLDLPEDVISIEDIYTQREQFEGKSFNVYGVVWKVNNGILDRNWVHIEDGTSTEDKASLAITTSEMVKVGDTIKLNGKLTLNKDFGYGYVYEVLLEEGKLIK